MSKKKFFSAVPAGVVAALVLSGCGGSGDAQAEATASASATSTPVVVGQPGVVSASASASPSASASASGSGDSGIQINLNGSAPSPSASASSFAAAAPTALPGDAYKAPEPSSAPAEDSAPVEAAPAPESGSGGSWTALEVADGTTIMALITQDTVIYAEPSTDARTIGSTTTGGQFRGVVQDGGLWVKIDRMPGYVKADAVSVKSVL